MKWGGLLAGVGFGVLLNQWFRAVWEHSWPDILGFGYFGMIAVVIAIAFTWMDGG